MMDCSADGTPCDKCLPLVHQILSKEKHLQAWEASLKHREELLQRAQTQQVNNTNDMDSQEHGKKDPFTSREVIGDLHSWHAIASCLECKDVTNLSQASNFMHSFLKDFMEVKYSFRVPLNYVMKTLSPKRMHIKPTLLQINTTATHMVLPRLSGPSLDFTQMSQLAALVVKAFNQPIDHKLPASLTYLKLGHSFNHTVDALPPALARLWIGDSFNQPINLLPPSLIRLSIGDSFDQPVDHLPPNLVRLSLGASFDQPINKLPQTLTHLLLGDGFDQPLLQLPPLLVLITTGVAFSHSVEMLSPTVSHLPTSLYKFTKKPNVKHFPFAYMSKHGEVLEFDSGRECRERFGMVYGDRVVTPRGGATVIGTRGGCIWFHCDGDNGASYWDNVTYSEDLMRIGIYLLRSN